VLDSLLIRTVSQTLLDIVGDPKHLGAELDRSTAFRIDSIP
jgi:hypothetical protein